MPVSPEMLEFIGHVTGKAEGGKKYEEQLKEKSNAIAEVVEGGLDGPARDELRNAMTFVMKDRKGNEIESISAKGQEHEIDSGDTKNLQGLDPTKQPAIQKAMDMIVKMKADLQARKGKDGEPLFTDAEIADELFTRLHREGLMPENLIIDEYSKTAQLLGASMKAYKKMLDDIRAEKEKAKAKQRVDFHKGGNKRDMLKALGGELSDVKDSVIDATAGQVFAKVGLGETKEDRNRMLDLSKKTVMVGVKIASIATDGKDLHKAIEGITTPTPDPKVLAANFVQSTVKTYQNPDQAEAISKLLSGHFPEIVTVISNAMKDDADEVVAVGEFLSNLLDTNVGTLVESAVESTPSVITGAIGNITDGVALGAIKKVYEDSVTKTKLEQASALLVAAIDLALKTAVGRVNPLAGPMVAGAYGRAVDAGEIAEMATADDGPDAKGIIDALAEGFVECMNVCNPDPEGTAFARVGQEMSKAFKGKVGATALAKAIKEKPAAPFGPLRAAADAAVARALGLPAGDGTTEKGGDPTAAEAVTKALNDPTTAGKVAANLADAQSAEISKEWEASEEEQEEYERMLILVDEGGDFMAEQRSIENLISKLEADRKTLELIASVGSELSSMGSLVGTMVTDGRQLVSEAAGEAAKHLTGPIGAAIQSAQLIAQLTVNGIQAAKRWQLWNEFRVKVEKTKRARSALLPAIQNFYENKKEQVTYHTIEDAMLAIQLAGTITQCVPHEVAQAAGKLVTAVGALGQAANTAAFAGYNEVQLRKAWATTRAAINNPASRSVGLAALHQNPTLAMYAVAWASVGGDRMARSILQSTGINEETLAHHQGDAGTEKKIVDYLEALLDEDRKLKDSEKIKVAWYPSKVELTRESWLISKNRAMTKANPKMGPANTGAIEAALRLVQAQGDPEAIRAQIDKTPATTLIQNLKQVETLVAELGKFVPYTPDRTLHDEMAVLTERYTALARQRRLALAQLRDEKAERVKIRIGGTRGTGD